MAKLKASEEKPETLKVKYVGKKPKISLMLPLSAQSKGEIDEVIEIKKNEEILLPFEDAIKLVSTESGFEYVDFKPTPKKMKLSEVIVESAED